MEFRMGVPLFKQQFKALLEKNLRLLWRSKISTCAQLLSPILFFFLLSAITQSSSEGDAVYDPVARTSPPIPPCESRFYINFPCFDFVWSGNHSAKVALIVRQIMANNPGRVIPPNKVKSFETKEEVDEWLYNNPMHCPGALHFAEISDDVISYGLQSNSTLTEKRGQFEDTVMKFQIPLQLAAEREVARSLIGDPNFVWLVGLKEFAHPANHDGLGNTFFFLTTVSHLLLAVTMLHFVFQNSSLVMEKELKHRQAMTVMNLYDSAYWLCWLTSEAIFGFVLSLIAVLCGMMFRLPWFVNNSFIIIFLVFFLSQLSMIGFSFMLSTVIQKAYLSLIMGLSIFVVSYLSQYISLTLLGFPYYPSTPFPGYQILWSLFPPNLFTKSIQMLHIAAGQGGLSWSTRSQCFDLYSVLVEPTKCTLTMTDIFKLHIAMFFLWFVVAIYLDNVIPKHGVRRPILYFLHPGYWTGEGGKFEEGGILSCLRSIPQVKHEIPDDEDVVEEENTIKGQLRQGLLGSKKREGLADSDTAVHICGLVKTYPAHLEIGCCTCSCSRIGCCRCCTCSVKPHIHAVKGLWIAIRKKQLFCLLGPKGAGKTTVVNCLTGVSPATSGDVLVYGNSVLSSAGMSNIRRLIGVCPQFDIIWDALSGEEHLNFFAKLKGIPPPLIRSAVYKLLADVNLADAAKGRASSYSIQMKRSLSIAIALIGDPKLVILDEPTAGMDLINQQHIWDIIETAKKQRTIILTTHSSEEADILGDRIGIVAKGKLCSIGTSVKLRSKFRSGLATTVSFFEPTEDASDSCRDAFKNLYRQHFNVRPKEETEDSLSYLIPCEKENLLTSFVAELEDRQQEFGKDDIQIGLPTLEQVFLKVIKKAALKTAEAEDNFAALTLESGIQLMVPLGAEIVGIPESASTVNRIGLMVDVYWGQDSDGNLYITGHSPETPIPEPKEDEGLELPPLLLRNGDPPVGIPLKLNSSHL